MNLLLFSFPFRDLTHLAPTSFELRAHRATIRGMHTILTASLHHCV